MNLRVSRSNKLLPHYRCRSSMYRLAILVVAAATVLTACGSSAVSSTAAKSSSTTSGGSGKGTPYVIHAILSETGSATFLGSREKKSIEALASDVNSHGGIDGHPIKLDILDNQSNPSVGVSLVSGGCRQMCLLYLTAVLLGQIRQWMRSQVQMGR